MTHVHVHQTQKHTEASWLAGSLAYGLTKNRKENTQIHQPTHIPTPTLSLPFHTSLPPFPLLPLLMLNPITPSLS